MNMKFKPGDIVPATTLESVTGESIKLPDPNRLVHLQLRRFVDCPICNTHIAEMRGRAREIEAAGIKEVIVFHSSTKSIRSYQKDLPFVLVGDPKKALYKEFGVKSSLGFISLKSLGTARHLPLHRLPSLFSVSPRRSATASLSSFPRRVGRLLTRSVDHRRVTVASRDCCKSEAVRRDTQSFAYQ